MTVEIVAKVAASASLDEINGIIAENELVVGPLTQIGIEKGRTALSFAVGTPPTVYAVIAKDVDGTPVVPDGATVIDTDQIMIMGVPILCTATRL